jgi:hypothetical protein
MPDSTGFYYIADVIRIVMIIEAKRQKDLRSNDSLVGLPAVTFKEWQKTSFRGQTLTPVSLNVATSILSESCHLPIHAEASVVERISSNGVFDSEPDHFGIRETNDKS